MSCFDHQNFDDIKIPLIDIQNATNDFAEENLIRLGGFGKIYEGTLSRSENEIEIVARRLDRKFGQGTKEFQQEIMMLSSLKHPNLVSMVGFCDENDEKIIVNKYEMNGSLDLHLSDPTITWTQRLKICLGIARALSYIHYEDGRSFSVIHRNIKSSKILLDEKWEAKLSGFGLSITQPADERHGLVLDHACGTHGYVDPSYIRSESVSHKSDVYSFGVILFKVLCRHKVVKQDMMLQLLAELAAKSHDEKNKDVIAIIHPGMRMQMDSQSLKLFAKATYCCLNEQRSQRPSIDAVIVALEQALKLQLSHENSFVLEHFTHADHYYWQGKSMEHLKIGLNAIKLATENFSEKYLIGSGGYGSVYKAQLEHYDSSAGKDNKELELPRIRSNAAIKYIYSRPDEQGQEGFFAEIKALNSCKHTNVVSLLGFCYEPPHMIIVYEYVSNGSLDDYLIDNEKRTNLTWVQRINICIDIARGLHYLHTTTDHKQKMIHRDMKSANILLDENCKAKIADFGLSMIDHIGNGFIGNVVAGTDVYLDPEYLRTGKVTTESDVYTFGVVLFEILSGRLAYDSTYTNENEHGLAPIVRQHFEKGTIKQLVDPNLEDESTSTISKGPNQDSLNTFIAIGYKCLAEKQADRPTMNIVIEKLEKALKFQAQNLKHLRIGLDAIMSATDKFSQTNFIGSGGYAQVYKATLDHFDPSAVGDQKELELVPRRRSTVAIKCIQNKESSQGEEGFFTEIEALSSSMHPNVVSLLGFCYEPPHMILVYEHLSNGSLDDYLSSKEKMANLTWVQRIKICIDIASGLHYLHNTTDYKEKIIHRDIKSANILLGEKLEAKIADFGLSKLNPLNHLASTINTNIIAGTPVYLDPEYQSTGKLKKESDVYSFGVVLFEIMSGTLAYDPVYTTENKKGFVPVRQHFEKGTIKEMLDPRLKDEGTFTLSKEPNQDSLLTFSTIGHRCLAEKQANRPTMEEVIEELNKALHFQETRKDGLRISFDHISSATQTFSNQIGHGRLGKVYRGEMLRANGRTPIAVKRYDENNNQGGKQFLTEIEILFEYKHENMIGLVGYCDENNEKILVYEYASSLSLDKHLKDGSLTWTDRLKIGIDVAMALEFLHGGSSPVVHRNLKSSNILLNEVWKAKISDFGLSTITPIYNEIDFVVDDVWGIPNQGLAQHTFLTKETDIYSLGVVLCEMMCGTTVSSDQKDERLVDSVKRQYEEGNVRGLVFEGIKDQIKPKSLIAFLKIAYECLYDEVEKRPTAGEVVSQLKKALSLSTN